MEKFAKAINFEFTDHVFEPEKKRAVFSYKTEFEGKDPIIWKETIILPEVPQNNVPEKLLQSLHIILGISYYKFHCAQKITFAKKAVVGGPVDQSMGPKEAEFWNTVYKKGLGEFFYKNNLDPKISPKFPFDKNANVKSSALATNEKYLVGVSGGKDSLVSVEILKDAKKDITAFYVETLRQAQGKPKSELADEVTRLTGLKQLKIQRILDEKVFERHQYNGHIPISAIYAFLGVFASVLYGYKGLIVSNEYSSNFGNVKYNGLEINHQWSKSFEFEKMFSDYVKEFISKDLEYFSLLRPFYEIRIAEMFSKYPKYFRHFSSCNKNFSLGKTGWCGKCPKCVFVFILLSAFLGKKELTKIFGKNLYRDQNLLPLFKDVLGLGKLKPFDCVGTFEEASTAFKIASKKYKSDFIVRQIEGRAKISSGVFKMQAKNNIPEQFRLLGIKNILILGFGKEGSITKKYLHKFYPKIKIGIADKKQTKNYLAKQDDFDMAVKTPSINKRFLKIPYTTATNIFFSEVLGKNTIIGVTGSKGKSTTANLIYEILRSAGKNVKFLGNIGSPMLEALLQPIAKDAIFVLELSSYQLDDITFSPDISVVTNLFPEHMDFHLSLKNYYNAKKNIINFQNKNNYFVYNPENKILQSWLKKYAGKAIPFTKSNLKTNLLGEHNQSNIGAAIQVAKIFDIPKEIIARAAESFKGLEHRLEYVGEFSGIKFYDDAISTTPESTKMAIKALKKVDTIFLGGQDRGYNFSQLEKVIKKYKIRNIVLFPDSGKRIKEVLRRGSGQKNLRFFETKSMKKAVEFAYKYTEKGNSCLLSCASPSYSLWKNFEEKGNLFKNNIKKLANETPNKL